MPNTKTLLRWGKTVNELQMGLTLTLTVIRWSERCSSSANSGGFWRPVSLFPCPGDTGRGLRSWVRDVVTPDLAFNHIRVIYPTAPARHESFLHLHNEPCYWWWAALTGRKPTPAVCCCYSTLEHPKTDLLSCFGPGRTPPWEGLCLLSGLIATRSPGPAQNTSSQSMRCVVC